MKKIAFRLTLLVITFSVGVFSNDFFSPNTDIAEGRTLIEITRNPEYNVADDKTLIEITRNPEYYHGKYIEVVDFISIPYRGADYFGLRDREKTNQYDAFVIIRFSDEAIKTSYFLKRLEEDFSLSSFKRVKVLVKGTIRDHCKDLGGCRYGRTMMIDVDQIEQVGNFETYSYSKD